MKKITVSTVLYFTDGIGTKKLEYRDKTGLISENNRNYSDLVHSYGSKENFSRFLSDLASFAKEKGYQNSEIRLDKITGEIFKEYLKEKIDNGISQKTVSNIISQAQKLSYALEKINNDDNVNKFADKNELIAIKNELRPSAEKIDHVNRGIENKNVEKIINNITDDKSRISAILQVKAGLRESEALNIKSWQLKNDNKIEIQGKGGYHRTIRTDKDTYEKIKNYIHNEGSFKIDRNKYEKELKTAFSNVGIEYKGTHALRYTYAQNSFIAKISGGFESKEALRLVSEELGHHRFDITLHYLK
jgi:integrase